MAVCSRDAYRTIRAERYEVFSPSASPETASSAIAPSTPSASFLAAFLASLSAFLAAAAAFFSPLVSFFSKSGLTSAAGAAGAAAVGPPIRGRSAGGASPAEKVSGTSAAAPAPPPTQPSIGESQSMPSLLTPPTAAFLTVVPSRSSQPTMATTTRLSTRTFDAFVTIVSGSPPLPMSTSSACSLSLPATGETAWTTPTTKAGMSW
mmetsp:Transcript_10456/g.34869  ORF Transcript_10456/g.34869 Transcript_10456/m.34869 type:complete len:206 (+) Transcript_10456:48-665(+)